MYAFYNEQGDLCEYGNLRKVKKRDYVSNNFLFRVDKKRALKVFNIKSKPNLEVLRQIKDMRAPGMYEIYDLLFSDSGRFSAMTTRWYESSKRNLVTGPAMYIYDNFLRLAEAMEMLAEANIVPQDLHTGNVILGKDMMTLIDADDYDYNHNPEMISTSTLNLGILKGLFIRLLEEHFMMTQYYDRGYELPFLLNIFYGKPGDLERILSSNSSVLDAYHKHRR